MKILAFTGKAQSGKNLSAQLITEMSNLRVVELSFAQPIKELCADIFGFIYDLPREAFFGDGADKAQYHQSLPGWNGRMLLQYIGTECFRTVNSSVWCDHITKRITTLKDVDLVLVTDARYPDEVEALKKLGAKIIRITRESTPNIHGIKDHASEMHIDDLYKDIEISNSGTLEELREKLNQLL